MITQDVNAAARALVAGDVVAFATETVYGLGADASQENAVANIFEIKGRPSNHPLIVHVSCAMSARYWLGGLSSAQGSWFEALTRNFWPGPLTLIVPRAQEAAGFACGGQSSIGLRCPSHPVAQLLLQAFEALGGKGVAAPSANRFGKVSPTTAAHVLADLGADVGLILDGGNAKVGIESTIVSLLGDQPALLRPGAITIADLETVLKQSVQATPNSAQPQVSGSLDSHYAPNTPVELVASASLAWRARTLAETGDVFAIYARQPMPESLRHYTNLRWNLAPTQEEDYAAKLYAALRELDALQSARIVVEAVPAEGLLWQAIADRLKRSAHPRSP